MTTKSQMPARTYGVTASSAPNGGLPFANWVMKAGAGHASSVSADSAPTPSKAKTGKLDDLMAALQSTLERDSEALAVIQRLAYRVDCTSELAMRARSYAAEFRSITLRIESHLPRAAGAGATSRHPASAMPKSEIDSLDEQSAAAVLLSYLIQHAKATQEVLAAVGEGLNAKAITMLCRKAEREKQALISWIEKERRAKVRH